jgi:hypothetical protein
MNTPYSMSFTTGALLYPESLIVAGLYEELGDWTAVREKVVRDNRLQMRTRNASERICQEVISRLKLLASPELDLLTTGSHQEQNQLLWLAACKRYRFIHDFAVEVLREKFLRLDLELAPEEYDRFFHDKAEWHPEVARVAQATREKQRQVVFKMLREAGLLTQENHIAPAMLTPALVQAVGQNSPDCLAIYPVADSDIKLWTR